MAGPLARPHAVGMDEDRLARLEATVATLTTRIAELEGRRPAVTQPVPSPPLPAVHDLEAKLGSYWLSRIGIVSLISGAALLVITYFGELGPALRIALGYAMAGALGYLGLRVARTHETFGRLVFAGGLAIGYFVTYALHFVPAMRVIDSEPLAIALLAAAITGIVATAHRMKSETVAGVALFLGLHTGMLSDVTALSLVATTLLAAGAGFFLAANRWVVVPLSTVVAVYTTHATLAYHHVALAPEIALAFLAVAFLLFAIASLVSRSTRPDALVALALLNCAGFTLLGLNIVREHNAAPLFVAIAIAHGLLALVARLRHAPTVFVGTLLAIAFATFAFALGLRLEGWLLLGGWIALALAAGAISRAVAWAPFAWIGALLLGASELWLFEDPVHPSSLVKRVVGAVAIVALERITTYERARLALTGLLAIALVALGEGIFEPSLQTVAYVGAAFAMFAIGFALRRAPYRWAGFAMLAIAATRFLSVELGTMSAGARIATFVITGAVLLVVSFVYTRARSRDVPGA